MSTFFVRGKDNRGNRKRDKNTWVEDKSTTLTKERQAI